MLSKPAKSAYLIAGHGLEAIPGDTFPVPEGCYIVVKAKIGELTDSIDFHRQVSRLCDIDHKKLEDPKKYEDDIVNAIKSNRVYKPGEDCPNFRYRLVACDKKEYNKCGTYGSGVINLKKLQTSKLCANPLGPYLRFNSAQDPIDFISNLYENSILPTKRKVELYLKGENRAHLQYVVNDVLKEDYDVSNVNNDDLNSYELDQDELDYAVTTAQQQHRLTTSECLKLLLQAPELIDTDQRTLCKLHPGAYYNFVCRQIENVTNALDQTTHIKPSSKNNVTKTFLSRLSNTIHYRKPQTKRYDLTRKIRNLTHKMDNARPGFLKKSTMERKQRKKMLRRNNLRQSTRNKLKEEINTWKNTSKKLIRTLQHAHQ
jgi:hypothetical protein